MLCIPIHYERKETIIIGDVIHNGCQTFHIKDLDDVALRHCVPKSIVADTRRKHRDNAKIGEDWGKLNKMAITNGSIAVMVAMNGKLNTDNLIKMSWSALGDILNAGVYLREIFRLGINCGFVSDIASKVDLNDIEFIEELLEESLSHPILASRGLVHPVLINSPVVATRIEYARKGKTARYVAKDPYQIVRREVASRGYQLSKLVYDKSIMVRVEVARYPKYSEQLYRDQSVAVREMVARCTTSLSVALKLQKDASPIVREAAKQRTFCS